MKRGISDSMCIIERFGDMSHEVIALQITSEDDINEVILSSEFDGAEDVESYEYTFYSLMKDSLFTVSTVRQSNGKINDTIVKIYTINEKGVKEIKK
ncbi:hypothetical protein [Pseudofulvibacter geojedonensis]|uniref:Uncharacterized protein n=1 Tax=Pseudofulvibacter geojedonensis TaxID=1123758 RepID=A0ABW3I243_9FLAO